MSLLEHVFETSGKVIHAETRLLIASLIETLQKEIRHAVKRAAESMIMVLAALFAFAWLSVAAVTLLHERFSRWESEGIVGVALLVLVLGVFALMTRQRVPTSRGLGSTRH